MNVETYSGGKLIKTENVSLPPPPADEARLDALKVRILAETATATEVRETLKLLMKTGRL